VGGGPPTLRPHFDHIVGAKVCEFGMFKIFFLDHVISHEGVKVDE